MKIECIRPQIRAALIDALGDALDCTRDWGAWSVGTMKSDDFVPVSGDDERIDEIVDAVLAPVLAAQDVCDRVKPLFVESE